MDIGDIGILLITVGVAVGTSIWCQKKAEEEAIIRRTNLEWLIALESALYMRKYGIHH